MTHPFPTRRSSDLDDAAAGRRAARRRRRAGRGLPDKGLAGALRHRAGGRPAVSADAAAGLGAGAGGTAGRAGALATRSEEHTSELQSLMRNSYAVFCLNKKKISTNMTTTT